MSSYIKNFVTGYGIEFKQNIKNKEPFEKAPIKWAKIGRDLGINNDSVILFCGAKNNGKSSLVRYLINEYVFKRDTSHEPAISSMDGSEEDNSATEKFAYYIDYDPGQPELTTPGIISAHIISSHDPELVNPTYLNLFEHESIVMSSIGGLNMSVNPKMYIQNCRFAYNQVKEHRNNQSHKRPIFINTMGFVRNVGLAMLTDLIKICRPTDLVVLNIETDPMRTIYCDLSANALQNTSASFYYETTHSHPEPLKYNYLVYNLDFSFVVSSSIATCNRTAQQLAYLARIPEALYKPIMQLNSKWLSLESTSVYCESSFPLNANIVVELLYHSWVHLVKLRRCSVRPTSEKPSLGDSQNICRIIDELGENLMFGCGIVADIDFEKRRLALITPLSQEILDNEVDCLVKPLSIQVAREIIQSAA